MSVKVFLSCSCLNANSGVLLGYYDIQKGCYYVISITPLEKFHSVLSELNFALSPNDDKYEALGLWMGSTTNSQLAIAAAKILSCNKWIILSKSDLKLSLVCVQKKREIDIVKTLIGVVIIYDEKCILDGKNLLPKFMQHLDLTSSTKPITSNQEYITSESNGNCHQSVDLSHVADAEMVLFLYSKVLKYHLKLKTATASVSSAGAAPILDSIHRISAKFFLLKLLWLILSKLLISFKCYLLDKLLQFSSIGMHLSLKLKLLSSLRRIESTQQQKRDIASAIVIDCFLGMLFCFWILSHSNVWFYASKILMPSVDVIAKNVEVLIRWLMGIPIGLKLNSPLNQFLGKFFLHHVRLWLEYIQMILMAFAPGNHFLLWPFYITCFGFSFFIAMLSDIVSLLTFHVYCFYVYATRLYGLQIGGVMSFWRLFRGKKWNPLRNRVDTLPHSPDIANHRFFTGTLLFTILLFLLPTTALYYAIFTFLRLLTLCLQKPLHWLCWCISCFPWFSFGLRCIRPNAFVTHARFNRTDSQKLKVENAELVLKKISLPLNLRKSFVQDLTVLALVLDVLSYRKVVCSGIKRSLGCSLFSSFNWRDFSINLLSGKLMKWS